MTSPCHDCALKKVNKNNQICRNCNARHAYSGSVDHPNILENISKEIPMAQTPYRGTCENCERENMTLPNNHLCGTCNNAFTLTMPQTPEAIAEAMLAVKNRMQKKARKTRTKKEDPLDAATDSGVKIAPAGTDFISDENTVVLEFATERDKKLLDVVRQMSNESRRTISQEVLFIMEEAIGV